MKKKISSFLVLLHHVLNISKIEMNFDNYLTVLKNEFQHKWKTTVLTTAGLFLTLFVFAPINLYLVNWSEFLLSFEDILVLMLPLAMFSSICFSVLILFFRTSFHKRIISLIVAMLFLLWFQGNIIVWQYGPLDGRAIHWNAYWVFGAVDTSIWILVIFLSVIKASFFYKFSHTVTMIIILIQVVSVSITFIQARENWFDYKKYIFNEASRFNFSKEKNVLLIVLDSFQSNIFQEIITQDESYANIFGGFTYFQNALTAFNFTELSMPAMLTGKMYDNSVKKSVFLKEAFLDKSIPKVLKENNFVVDMFPSWPAYRTIYCDERIYSNLIKHPGTGSKTLLEILFLLDFSLFRYLPHFAKEYIYHENLWFLHRLVSKKRLHVGSTYKIEDEIFEGKRFTDNAALKSQFQIKNNVFKFYYFRGLHLPLRVNEKSRMIDQITFNKENFTKQAMAYLKMCERFFDILKQKGVFDNCLIFVVADHGMGMEDFMYINPLYDSGNIALDQKAYSGNFQSDKARGIPLVLVKPFNSRGKMIISDAPVSLIDIPDTIMSELGIKVDFPGISMFEASYHPNRKRYYGAFGWVQLDTDFVEPITMYSIIGSSWSNASWDVQSILYPKSDTLFESNRQFVKKIW